VLLLGCAAVFFRETNPTNTREGEDVGDDKRRPATGGAPGGVARSIAAAFSGALAPFFSSKAIVIVSIAFCLLYSTVNAALSGIIIGYSKLRIFSMSDALDGWFLAVPWMIRAFATAVLFPALLRYFVGRRAGRGEDGDGRVALLEAAAAGEDGGGGGGDASALRSTCIVSVWFIRAGGALSTVVFGLFGLATSTTLLFVFCSVEGLAAVWDAAAVVALSSLGERSRQRQGKPPGGASDQGTMLGLRGALQLSMAVVGPLLFNAIFTSTVQWVRPFVFYVLSGCCATAVGVSFLLREADM
jgi:hypothetical protein